MPASTDYQVNNVLIANGQTTSDFIPLYGNDLVGLQIPSTWEGGNITIMGSYASDGVFVDVYDSSGSIVTLTVGGASRIVSITGTFLQAVANVPFIKLKAASAVGANRTIIVTSKG